MASENTFTETWGQSDVSFTVEGGNVYGNKAILSMWSPVFNAMFSDGFKESDAAVVDLPRKQYNHVLELVRVLHPPNKPVDGKLSLGLGKSSFLLLEYSAEYLIEYSSIRQGK